MKDQLVCPRCGQTVEKYRNPFPTVDIIIELDAENTPLKSSSSNSPESSAARVPRIVLIRRKNPPFGWALPGGFVDYGETLESAARREASEETCLEVKLRYQLGAYSDPARDPRHHTISVVFVGRADGIPEAADDAADIGVFDRCALPEPIAFDHSKILADYFEQWHLRG